MTSGSGDRFVTRDRDFLCAPLRRSILFFVVILCVSLRKNGKFSEEISGTPIEIATKKE